MALKILLQNKKYLAIHKPSGLLTYSAHPPHGAKEILEKQMRRTVYPIHRIDKDTCGILLFAFSNTEANEITSLFQSRKVKKRYLAIVHGRPAEQATINKPLQKPKSKEQETAITKFIRLASVEVDWDGEARQYSLISCEMQTGRYHQIRRHMRLIGHPICGDPQYGNKWNNEAFKKRFHIGRTLLSAVRVEMPDNFQQKIFIIETRPDPDFRKVMTAFGWNPKSKF